MNKYVILTQRYINLMEAFTLSKNKFEKRELKEKTFIIRKKISSTKYLEIYCHLNNIDPNTFERVDKKQMNFIKNLPTNYF